MHQPMQRPANRTAVLVGLLGLLLSCHKQIDWSALNEQTVERNLGSLRTAEDAYLSQLASGNISAAAQEALANLLGQPGVDTATISPDSTVWVIFDNGLVAGICEQTFDTTAQRRPVPARNWPDLEQQPVVSSGGVVAPSPRIFAPFAEELLGTALETYDVWEMCRGCYGLRRAEFWVNSAVTVQCVRAQLQDARSLFFWTGHGCLVSPFPGAPPCAALLTGKSYSQGEMAAAIATEFRDDTKPGPSGPRLAFAAHGRRFYPVILPEFVRAYGRFDNSEPYWKTMAYITACFSAYQTNPELEQAFHDAGADLFCGYDWAVNDMFAYNLDTTFIRAMTDTCLPIEALAQLGSVTDPDPVYGRNASFRMSGDTLVMLRHVLDGRRDGRPFRAGAVIATAGGQVNLQGAMVAEGDSEPSWQVTVACPGNTGSYNIETCDDAFLCLVDNRESRAYYAVRGYVGTSGTIDIGRYNAELISGRYSGTLGYWAPGLIPTRDQPTATLTIADGCIKHTGWRVGSLEPMTAAESSALGKTPLRGIERPLPATGKGSQPRPPKT